MPLPKDSNKVNVSLVLTRRQWEQIKAIARQRSVDGHEPSISSIAREVIALGLDRLAPAPHMSSATMTNTTEAA